MVKLFKIESSDICQIQKYIFKKSMFTISIDTSPFEVLPCVSASLII